MINIEQVKLLEAKVSKTIDFVDRISKENAALIQREAELQEKLESYQKRIDELEVHIRDFKEEHGRIEEGFFAVLDKLSQFEDSMEKSLKEKPHGKAVKDTIKPHGHNPPQKTAAEEETPDGQSDSGLGNEKICFEIPEEETADDILDPLTETDEDAVDGDPPAKGEELDIF
jgi:predicted nuclease with TOPRIM domain